MELQFLLAAPMIQQTKTFYLIALSKKNIVRMCKNETH